MSTLLKLSNDELRSLAADVTRLSTLLTRERERLPAAYLGEARLRKAYLAYFLPSYITKIHAPLKELARHPENPLQKEKLRVLDIGSGPGSALLGVMEFFEHQEKRPWLELTALDQVAENLKEAEKLFLETRERFGISASFRAIQSGSEGFERLVRGSFEVIILSNVLNELYHQDEKRIAKRVDMLKNLMARHLADGGSCIVIEPALRETSREMLEVRDGLLDQGIHIYAPCLFGGKCPALVNPKDWCHEDIPWDPPALVKELDALTGLRKDSLKFSYLVLRKDKRSLLDGRPEHAFRVVSEPLISKGKREYFLCGEQGRRLVTRQDKDHTPGNECFATLKRGDLVCFDGLIDEEKRFKVGKDTAVSLVL
jgi:ribosomal protein RSM22 (predicted rRNA methylase)